jgi:hypothetical protein
MACLTDFYRGQASGAEQPLFFLLKTVLPAKKDIFLKKQCGIPSPIALLSASRFHQNFKRRLFRKSLFIYS